MLHSFVSSRAKAIIGILALFALVVAIHMTTVFASTSSSFPGSVEGEDTHFEITDSMYLNISVTSSETIQAYIESIPDMITIGLAPSESATSTDIEIEGLLPSTTYYKYEDDYHNLQELTTDENGTCTYTQDLTEPHIMFIQTVRSTRFIKNDANGGDCASLGMWNQSTLTCTLGQDVGETIQIDANSITLDGAGHTVTGSGTGNGIYVPYSGVTIKNLTVQNFTSGIAAIFAYNTRVENVTATADSIGLNIRSATNTTAVNNDLTNNLNYGVFIGWYSAGNPSRNTQVYNNNFEGNYLPAFLMGDIGVGPSEGTILSLDPPIGGNYFDRFDTPAEGCVDTNVDGMCDSGWSVGSGYYDHHPWVARDGWAPHPPVLSSVQQFRGLGFDEVTEGSSFIGNDIFIKGQVSDPQGGDVQLEVELRPFSEAFDDTDVTHIYTSATVASGNEATVTVSDLIPKDEWYTAGGNIKQFHWRARAKNIAGSASDWQEFGLPGNEDFEARVVPLYTQKGSEFPSIVATDAWKDEDYGTGYYRDCLDGDGRSTIARCGCRITSTVMISKYYGLENGIDGSTITPLTMNNWLYTHNGYTVTTASNYGGNLILGKELEYLSRLGGGIRENYFTVHYDEGPSSSIIQNALTNEQPIVALNRPAHHYFVIDNKIEQTADTYTYTVRDPFWYQTRTLNEPTGVAGLVKKYDNVFNLAHVYEYHPTPVAVLGSLTLALGSPAELLITDPLGRRMGKDPVSGIEYNEIPEAEYFAEGTLVASDEAIDPSLTHESKYLVIPDSLDGHYDVKVIGTGDGPYTVTTVAYDNTGVSNSQITTGTTSVGQTSTYTLSVNTENADETTFVPSGNEGSLFCPLLAQSATYSFLTPTPTCTFTNGPKTLQVKDSSCMPIPGARVNVRKANGTYLTYTTTNTEGIADLSAYTNLDASYFELDHHGATYSTPAGTFSTGTGVQTHPYELSLKGSDCNAISGARVNLRKANDTYVTYATTNADGKASFEVVPEASMKLEADYHGGTWMSEARTPDTRVTLGTDKFSLLLTDSTSNPIQNARVNLRKENNTYVMYSTTNEAGRASFEVLPNASLKFEVDYHGATYQGDPSTTHEEEAVATIPFGLRLLDSQESPIPGVRVNLRKANNTYVTYALTDESGIASFEVVPGAQMKLEVDYHGATYATDALDAGTNPLTQIHTEPFGLRFLTNTGEPISGARVNLRKANGTYVAYATTDAGGSASFEVVPHSQMQLEVDHHGATYLTGALDVDTNPQTTVSAHAFALELKDSEGNPIQNVRVNLRKANDTYVTYTTTNDSGIASFQVVPEAEMLLEADYHGGTHETEITTISADTTLQMQTAPITVLLTVQGEPLVNTRVDLLKENETYVTYVTTSEAGSVSFEVLPEVLHKVRATYNGTTWVSEVVTGGAETVYDF